MAGIPKREKVLLKTAGTGFKEIVPEMWNYFLGNSGPGTVWPRSPAKRTCCIASILRPLSVQHPTAGAAHLRRDPGPLVPRSYEEMLLQRPPQRRPRTIEGCGHVPSYTHPEVLAEVIWQFLTPPRS